MLTYPETYIENGQTKRMPNPSRPIDYDYVTNNLEVAFESGHEQRRQKGLPKLKVDFSYKALTQAQADTLVNFFVVSCAGSVRPFEWTDPVSRKTYWMRFDMKQLKKEYIGHNVKGPIYSMNITMIQDL